MQRTKSYEMLIRSVTRALSVEHGAEARCSFTDIADLSVWQRGYQLLPTAEAASGLKQLPSGFQCRTETSALKRRRQSVEWRLRR